jgi:hypothetical protein
MARPCKDKKRREKGERIGRQNEGGMRREEARMVIVEDWPHLFLQFLSSATPHCSSNGHTCVHTRQNINKRNHASV